MTPTITGMNELAMSSSELGNKVKNLAALVQAGVRVPRGFGLPYDFYTDHIKSLLPDIRRAHEQFVDYADMAKQIQEIMVSKPFAGASKVHSALELYMPDATYFAVRSSGAPVIAGSEASEDSSNKSFAGQYESFLLVPRHNVPQAILLCYASLFSRRCLEEFNVKKDMGYLNSRMSVLIQEMCRANLSAVVFTQDPDDKNIFGMEITYGACEAIVSGEVTPDAHYFDRATGIEVKSQLGAKKERIEYEPLIDLNKENKVIRSVSDGLRERYAAPPELRTRIYDIGMYIERHFGVPQDIELVVADDEIIVVQTRPITTSE